MSNAAEGESLFSSPEDTTELLRDVNERLLLSALREHESFDEAEKERAHLSALLEALYDGVVIVDAAGEVIMVNGAARRIMGIDPARAARDVATFDLRRLDMTPLEKSEQPPWRALAGAPIVDEDLLVVRQDGDARHIVTTCTASSGVARRAIMVFRDVTERRKLEGRLAQSERIASLGTLAAGMAHELNNPLAYVTMNVELLLEELRAPAELATPERAARMESMLLEAHDGAERIQKIVAGLNTFSVARVERRGVLEVKGVVEAALALVHSQIRYRARLVKDYAPTPLVEVDGAHLAQVVANLLVNAAHATPEGDAERHEVRVAIGTDRSGNAFVDIHDTGGGIAPDVLPRIFDPFFTTKRVGAGIGLGLSICHALVKSMNGEIAVETKVGGGSTFRITLPAATDRGAPAHDELPGVEAAARSGTVLVVDDEPFIGKSLARILAAQDVTVVGSAQEAIDLVEAGRQFDVVLCDVMMPSKSGIELYEHWVRTAPRVAESVVFITGGAFTAEASAFLARVPNARFAKPFDIAAVRALVAARTQREEAEKT